MGEWYKRLLTLDANGSRLREDINLHVNIDITVGVSS